MFNEDKIREMSKEKQMEVARIQVGNAEIQYRNLASERIAIIKATADIVCKMVEANGVNVNGIKRDIETVHSTLRECAIAHKREQTEENGE